jgi:hypothetical protein
MIKYFYRKIGTADFIKASGPKTVLPIRLKNKYVKENQYFCSETQQWKVFTYDIDSLTADFPQFIPVEFIEWQEEPDPLVIHYDPINLLERTYRIHSDDLCFESFTASQISEYLDYVDKKHRYDFYQKISRDSNNMAKNIFSVCLETDEKNFTLKITTQNFESHFSQTDNPDNSSIVIPTIYEEFVFFDLKNGTIEGCRQNLDLLLSFERSRIPYCLRKHIFQSFLALVQRFTDIPYVRLHERYSNALDKYNFIEMYKLTKLPYEPDLYFILTSEEYEKRQTHFNYSRLDPNIYAKFCEKTGIQNTKIVRRCFNNRPESLLTYFTLKDCGFTDINLYNRVLENEGNCYFFDTSELEPLKFFTLYSIKKRGEIATMNTLLKDKGKNQDIFLYDEQDAIEMFERFFEHIPEALRNDILRDGFTEFNHDALTNIAYRCQHKNKSFKYSAKQRALCDNIDGYEFCLPENTYQLLEIGTNLHNCVATYDKSVLKNKCTIVYVRKDGEYKICIEVRENEIIQERTNHNENPSKEEQKILEKWHIRHKLVKNQ